MASSVDMFIPIKFNTTVQLKPNELGPNLQEIIYSKLKNGLENMCSKHGYIKKNSIKIIKRSIGALNIAHFNGNIIYNLQCVAEICNPAQGSIIKCKVKAKNSLGLLAEGFYDNYPILQVIVPKISAGIQSEVNIDNINIGDEINIEVCGKKLLLYDKNISIIGKVIKDKTPVIKNENGEDLNEIDEDKIDDIETIQIVDDLVDFDEEKSELFGEGEEEDDNDEEEDELSATEEEDDEDTNGEFEGGDDFDGIDDVLTGGDFDDIPEGTESSLYDD